MCPLRGGTGRTPLPRRCGQQRPNPISPEQFKRIQTLGSDIRQVWTAPTITDRDRKELLHTLLEEVRNLLRYYAAVRLPGTVHEGRALVGSPSGPPLSQGCGQHRDLLVPVHRVSMHAWGLRPRGAGWSHRDIVSSRVAFRFA